MLELGGDKLARGLGRMIATDASLRVVFELVKGNADALPVRFADPFIAADIPSADESLVVIRFANPKGIDFAYLLSMLHDSFMSRPNNIVVPGGKMGLAMQLIFTPMILRLIDVKRRTN